VVERDTTHRLSGDLLPLELATLVAVAMAAHTPEMGQSIEEEEAAAVDLLMLVA
jgi:hypothetical protein